jgi:glycosyltransferase involved in cell wall biosynthesis
MNETRPLVSVSMTTYNVEATLVRALDSVLMQKRTFPMEIVLGDDASTDGTLLIARAYRKRHPSIIRLIEREENVGIQRNTYDTLDRCRGRYTAWLDADDCWTDSDKLSIQVEILEANPEVNVCAHFVRWVTHDGQVQRERYPSIPAGRYGFDEVLKHNFIPGLSAVFRTGIHRDLPNWYFEIASLSDWPLWIVAALLGDVILIDKVMADYTLSTDSSFTSKGANFWYAADADFYERIEDMLPSEWHRIIRSERGKRYENLSGALREQGRFSDSRQAALKAFCSPFLRDRVSSKTKGLVGALLREWRYR